VNGAKLRVVLVAPRNPLNIGAAARAMSNFGFFDLHLVNPYEVAFREARSAVHAGAVLEAAHEWGTVAEATAGCKLVVGTTAVGRRELKHTVRRLEAGGVLIRAALAAEEPVALLFGSEKFGLSNEDMSHCHWLMRIPAREEHGSMNLGQAVAVCLYELIRMETGGVRAAAGPAKKFADAAMVERVADLLTEALNESGYVHSASTPVKVRRLVMRMGLGPHDAEVLLGMVRQVLWKVRKG
jgi:TrmH family RNA methyltransferase